MGWKPREPHGLGTNDAVADFLDSLGHRAPKTRTEYAHVLRYMGARIGPLTAPDLDALRAYLGSDEHAPATRYQRLAVCKVFWQFCLSVGIPLSARLRLALARRQLRVRKPTVVPQPLGPATMRALRRTVATMNPEYRPVFYLLDGCGLRVAEPLGLCREHASSLQAPRADARRVAAFTIAKRKRGPATVPLHEILRLCERRSAILAFRELHRRVRRCASGPVFPRLFALRQRAEWVRRQFSEHCRQADVESVHPRRLRPTFAVECAQELERRGDDVLRIVGRWLGHRDFEMTARYLALARGGAL